MKKISILFVALTIALMASANVFKIYVNPLKTNAYVDNVVAERLFKKGMLGLTKAKTIAVTSGRDALQPGSEAAKAYDYILDMTLTAVNIDEAGTPSNIIKGVTGIFGKQNDNIKTDWLGTLETEVVIRDAATGDEVYKTTLKPHGTDKDKDMAIYKATNHFDYETTDMTDNVFRTQGEVIEATELDKKNIVKKVRVAVGQDQGARKNQVFELYKVAGGKSELIGAAKCERVLSHNEAILTVNSKKGADKVLSGLIQNNDGTYTIEARSCAKSNFIHDNFQAIDKMFTAEGRSNYVDPVGRTSKFKVGFLEVDIHDSNIYSQKEVFENKVLAGMKNVSTINVTPTIYRSVESAREAGMDGLVEVSIDKVIRSTESTNDGKTKYDTEVYFTVTGIDASNGRWVEMQSLSKSGTSYEKSSDADSDAVKQVERAVRLFCENVFPVYASIINAQEVDAKKGAVKKVRVNVGTNMGLKSGLHFDVYEQRAEGGEESRFLLGTGKVDGKDLTATEATINISGKDGGEKTLYQLIQNADENTNIVLISKAGSNFLDKTTNFLGKKK